MHSANEHAVDESFDFGRDAIKSNENVSKGS